MKKSIVIFVITLLSIASTLFTGCMDLSENTILAVCGSYASPGMFCRDLKGGAGAPYSTTIIERDNEGRILYLYETTNHISGEWEKAYVICQKIDKDYVYFYEDVCYLPAHEGADLETMKALNDWDAALDEMRISARPLKVSFDLFIMTESELLFEDVKTAVHEAIGIDKEESNLLTLLDVSPKGQELYWLSLDEESYNDCYLIMVTPDMEVIYTKSDENYLKQLAEFKIEAEWGT